MNPRSTEIKDIRWVILDAMGVIFKTGDDVNDLLIPYLQKINPKITSRRVNELYNKARVGSISSRQFWKELGFERDCLKIERDYLDQCLEMDPRLPRFFFALKKKFQFGMLSNDVKEWSRYLRKKNKLGKWLKVAVISGEVGMRKPGKKIYSILLKHIKEPPSHCLFVDDRIKNLIPARKLGFKTILFSRRKGNDTASGFREVHSFKELSKFLK